MSWTKFFKSQCYNQPTFKHMNLPIYVTKEFDFFRCVEFKEEFYGKMACELFEGNLRMSSGRYSVLFPNQRISYWADSPKTARAEIKKHGASCDILTFWAYDDVSSFLPCLGNSELMVIVDGRKCGIQKLIDKIDEGKKISVKEKEMMRQILEEPIDGIAYDSKACSGGENFIFLEKGFRKLFMREVSLRFGRTHGGAHNFICCSTSSDYTPSPESYGKYFLPKSRVKFNKNYLKSEEYLTMKNNIEQTWKEKFGTDDED